MSANIDLAGTAVAPSCYTQSWSLCARWFLMLSHLYYDRALSLVSDHDFDRLGVELSEVWGEMDGWDADQLRWQLGKPHEIRSSGSQVKITRATVGGAEALARSVGREREMHPYTFRPFKRSKSFGCAWTGVSG